MVHSGALDKVLWENDELLAKKYRLAENTAPVNSYLKPLSMRTDDKNCHQIFLIIILSTILILIDRVFK